MNMGNLKEMAMLTKQDWDWLATGSEYQMAVTIQQLLQENQVMEAKEGLESLIEAMGRNDRRALKSKLIRLMVHIIKWKCQPQKRTNSWAVSILSARREIEDIQEEVPSLNRDFIESIWDKCFQAALKEAELEMRKVKCHLTALAWSEVFEDEYILSDDDPED
ncbi:conserved hypothetical protein [Planktothrix sp. PCC 11201]|uniref:DUF29 domain-containing protein n=1 Tax=Planktothrix sp. PCC 11201 TaxID=1729650 RepID=UPI0009165BDE|nr:DUF29 domain-containing protein [Planktothrix sp. PCC 11201]SKB11401.1 conserved hypothetical protein [Planktothrix sp. PCC 11201]